MSSEQRPHRSLPLRLRLVHPVPALPASPPTARPLHCTTARLAPRASLLLARASIPCAASPFAACYSSGSRARHLALWSFPGSQLQLPVQVSRPGYGCGSGCGFAPFCAVFAVFAPCPHASASLPLQLLLRQHLWTLQPSSRSPLARAATVQLPGVALASVAAPSAQHPAHPAPSTQHLSSPVASDGRPPAPFSIPRPRPHAF